MTNLRRQQFWILFYLDTSSNQPPSFFYLGLPHQRLTHLLVCSECCFVGKLNFYSLGKNESWKRIKMFGIPGWSNRLNFQFWLDFISTKLHLRSENQRNTWRIFIGFMLHIFFLLLTYVLHDIKRQRPQTNWGMVLFINHFINTHGMQK